MGEEPREEQPEESIDAAFAAMVEGLDLDLDPDTATPPAKAVKIAVVVTPIARADALASLCALSEIDCTVVPSKSGALAVKEFVSAHAQWDISELLGDSESEPAEASEMACALSRLSRHGVLLLTADLATDVGIETGLSGTMTARHYGGGQAGDEVSAGLVLAQMDQVVEDLVLGLVRPADAPGAVQSSDASAPRGMRWLGRGLRKPRSADGS